MANGISNFTKIGIVLLALGFIVVFLSPAIGLMVLGSGCILIGVGMFSTEIKFQFDKKSGKYKVLNGTVVDFKICHKRDDSGKYIKYYQNIYNYMEDGKMKCYESYILRKEKLDIGHSSILYKSFATGKIREETNWFSCLFWILITFVLGIAMFYGFILVIL